MFVIKLITLCIIGTIPSLSYGHQHQSILRELDATLNPDCPETFCYGKNTNTDTITLIHIIAKGPNDWLHYLWDFTGKPSIMIALTAPNTNLSIDWNKMLLNQPNVIQFTQPPQYTSISILNTIWQFNDTEDTGQFPVANDSGNSNNTTSNHDDDDDNTTMIIGYNLQNITWRRQAFYKSAHSVSLTIVGENAFDLGNGTIKLKLKCYGIRNHDIDLPHLLMSENSTQVDLILDHLMVNETFGGARFGTEFIMLADDAAAAAAAATVAAQSIASNQSFVMLNRKTLDDEHTPGIFHLVEIASAASYVNHNGIYLQYRPVSYTDRDRDVTLSTDIFNGPLNDIIDPINYLNGSLAFSYYGLKLDKVPMKGFNISFGQSGDGFYQRSKYNTWTFTMAYGDPPNEQLSMFVIIVASIGLGLPLLLLIFGGCFICTKRLRRYQNTI